MKAKKNIKLFFLSGVAITALVSIPSAVIACGSKDNSLQDEINKYIETVNKTTLAATTEVKSYISANDVNSLNINNYIENIPKPPATISVTYQISPDTYNGSISLVITASAEGATPKSSNSQTISGFQKAAELFVLEANKVLNQLSPNEEGKKTLVTDLNLNPSDKNYKSLALLLNTSVLPNSKGLTLTYVVSAIIEQTGSVTFYIIANQDGFSTQTNSVTISGFVIPTLFNLIQNLNLKPNRSFAPPQNTSNYLNFDNSLPIFANFELNMDQIKFLRSIKDLSIKVSNYSLASGSATLSFAHNINGAYNLIGQITYEGFYKGGFQSVPIEEANYFKNNDNVASWLNAYLNINSSWLVHIFTNNSQANNGSFFWGYDIASNSIGQIAFNNISVTNVNNIITIKAIMPNPISYNIWSSSYGKEGGFVHDGTTKANQAVTIQLPFVFQMNGNANTQILPNILTYNTGKSTISWQVSNNAGFTYDNAKYSFQLGDVSMLFRLKGQLSIDTISF